MREVLQSLRAAAAEVADVVPPRPGPGHLLIRSAASVVSAGTERMLVEFAHAGLVGKARQQPERVREVIDKARTDGVLTTVDAVRARLDDPLALGYANAGYVEAVGADVVDFQVGQLVASNGPHAELVAVPTTLCAVVPDSVTAEEAAFATLGAIALQGIRLAKPTLGERFVVTGLGLIGLLCVQLLRASGCEVLGIDFDPSRRALAQQFGATVAAADGEPVGSGAHFSRGVGVDGVIITASTTSSAPIHDAALMCRKRGRIVMVGVTGMELQRRDFYNKELSFQVSCSYGPGRYDPTYEGAATDYPIGFVRWTAGRNLAAVLEMIASGRLDVRSLITNRYRIDEASRAYTVLTEDPKALAIVVQYPSPVAPSRSDGRREMVERAARVPIHRPTRLGRVGVIGAGNFAMRVLLPAFKDSGAELAAISARGGRAASMAARRFEIAKVSNDAAEILSDPDIDTIAILTRHDSHAPLVSAALEQGKNVFVEKPLAIDSVGLESVLRAWESSGARGHTPVVGIGFNRRFAPVTQRMVQLLTALPGPRAISMVVNAGEMPGDHWTQDPLVGGGRIVGEACHFIDLARHLADSPIVDVSSTFLGEAYRDSAVVTLRHKNGSVATIDYFTNGNKRLAKERITVLCAGRALVNDNFRRLSCYGWPGRRGMYLLRQDKGHAEGVARFIGAVRGEQPCPIPFDEIIETSAASLLAACRV